MRHKRSATYITLAAYLIAFVLPELAAARAQAAVSAGTGQDAVAAGDVVHALGLAHAPSARAGKDDAPVPANAVGQPRVLDSRSPLSAAVLTAVGGRATQFSEVALLADWDGREDLTADRSQKVEDLSGTPQTDPDGTITRVAVSAHTAANGFNENVYYYGDSEGNVVVGADSGPGVESSIAIDTRTRINLPTVLNAFGSLQGDDQVVVTGVCVSPVVDLTAWANVNGAFAFFSGQIGEALIVTYTDFGGGLRLSTNNQLVRSGVLAFPIADAPSPAANPPGILSDTGFPVAVGGAFGVVFSTFSNLAGCAVDDDGSVYFQQVDLQQFAGANIVKITRTGENQDRAMATSGILVSNTLNPTGGVYGTASGPLAQVNRFTNYSGTSPAFGNISALAAGPGNTVYAAMAKSHVPGDSTTGLFTNDPALGATPSMVISFADAIGTFSPTPNVVVPDGFADAAGPGPLTPGVNNFRAFVHGAGPDRRGTNIPVFGTTASTLQLDFQVDYTIYSGLAVNEAREVFLISGGTPAGVGRNPSPEFGEIQVFTDRQPADRRADYVDLRGNSLPNPPASGGNTGDGDSDRFDHIFALAPMDAVTVTPTGLAGLARGFLRYTNRLAPNEMSPGVTLGLTARTQANNATAGPIFFGGLDPGRQVAGGDDQRTPFRGDNVGTGGFPPIPGGLGTTAGGFEFNFGATVGMCTAPWNALYLNSDGNVTFNTGSTTSPTIGSAASDMLTGPPRIAPAWRDFDPSTRDVGALLHTFPLQAVGFAGVNQFVVRWINVPRVDHAGLASRNTFTVTLFDDGTGSDENAAAGILEGPNDNRHLWSPAGVVPAPLRPEGTAPFTFEYGSMDSAAIMNNTGRAVVAGYSIGSQASGSVSEVNLSEVGRTSVVGAGTLAQTAIFEAFENSDFDLRAEGNDTALSTPAGQPDHSREILDFFGRACLPASLTLSVAITGSGSVSGPGIGCPGDCEEILSSGTTAVLMATPAAGFNFSNWLACDMPSGSTCTVAMNASKLVTAQFVAAPPPPQPLQGTLNQAAYSTGQVLTLSVTMDPALAGAGPVDAYIVVDLPGGAGSFSLQLPVGANILVPGQVKIAGPFTPFAFSGPVFSVVMPGTIPAGTYQWRTFLTQAGTMNVIGSVDVTPFTFTP